jgi:hypothetical protein
MLTLDKIHGARTDAELRRRYPQLPSPLVLPWSELFVLGLDHDTPWIWGPIERDPMVDCRGQAVLPRREIQQLRKIAAVGVPFQRIAIAHELDPDGAVRGLLPELRGGPRTCTDAVARAVVGPQPLHPAVLRAVCALNMVLSRKAFAAVANLATAILDPVVFGVVSLPRTNDGQAALWYPLAAWRW